MWSNLAFEQVLVRKWVDEFIVNSKGERNLRYKIKIKGFYRERKNWVTTKVWKCIELRKIVTLKWNLTNKIGKFESLELVGIDK